MLFSGKSLPQAQARAISPRLLAHVGDAVFHLYERELTSAATVSQLHRITTLRANTQAQAQLLDKLSESLTEEESDLVRRARNIKPHKQHRTQQAAYRKATAFEALLGYLYLTDQDRLKQLLDLTLPDSSKGGL